MLTHEEKISRLQQQLRQQNGQLIHFHYQKGHSNITRSKNYKKQGSSLDCSDLDQVLNIDTEQKRVLVEPRVTMDQLVKATLKYGLIPPIVPEFKGITVGGALMGAAAESTSHTQGIFFDSCCTASILSGTGGFIHTSPSSVSDLFYGLSGSYGSLGLLTSCELNLIPAKKTVRLRYTRFDNPEQAIDKLIELSGKVEFLDGIIFSPDLALIIEGEMVEKDPDSLPSFWFVKHALEIAQQHDHYEENWPLYDYLFRYDQGAFWMGAFLFKIPFLARYIWQGLLNQKTKQDWFTEKEVKAFNPLYYPNSLIQTLTRPLMSSQWLWALLHKSENWVQNRLLIQDFCIPSTQAPSFMQKILKQPGIFPIWLCPIKGTKTPQIFAPHHNHDLIINMGVYGCPAHSAPMKEITQELEHLTHKAKGRKVLYSHSFYTEDKFWQIYPKKEYEQLRLFTQATGVWSEITDKVLST